MNRAKKIILVLLVAVVAIQFIQPARNLSNRQAPGDITAVYDVPDTVHVLLKEACYDCHSNNTRYPWYTYIQPVGWLMRWHITNGKEELNLNEYASYSHRKQANKLRSIAESIKDGSMPISSYLLMHKDAKLSQQQRAIIINWATRTRDSVLNSSKD